MRCLWEIITSTQTIKIACYCISCLLLFFGCAFCFNDLELNSKRHNDFYQIFIGLFFSRILNIWPLIGGVIFIIAIFGILAVIAESSKLLRLYGILTFLAFVLNAVIGGIMITTAIQQLSATSSIFTELINDYEYDLYYRENIDYMQNEKKCCGYLGQRDWNSAVPRSCCKDYECISYYENGCKEFIHFLIIDLIAIILIVSSSFSILLLLATIMIIRFKGKLLELNGHPISL